MRWERPESTSTHAKTLREEAPQPGLGKRNAVIVERSLSLCRRPAIRNPIQCESPLRRPGLERAPGVPPGGLVVGVVPRAGGGKWQITWMPLG